ATGSIDLAGALTVSAGQVDSGNTASMDAFSISVGLVTFDSVRPDVMVGGKTLAHLGGNFIIDAAAVNVTAAAPDNNASSDVFSLDVSLVNVGGGTTPVKVEHETSAYLADGGNVTVTGGALAFLATATAHAIVESFSVGIGLVGVRDITANATVAGVTRAFVGGNAVLNAGDVSLTARSNGNTADAALSTVGVSLVEVADLDPTATTNHRAETFIAGGANVTAGNVAMNSVLRSTADADVDTVAIGVAAVTSVNPTANATDIARSFVDGVVSSADLTLTANATRSSDANTNVFAIGVAGVAGADSNASTTGDTQVWFGSASRITATGNVAARAVANNRANAKSTGGGGGIIGVGTLESSATLTGGTTAYLNQNAQVLQAGNVEISAIAVNTAKADTFAGTGGVVSVRGAQATVNVTPVVEAVVDNNVSMQNVGGSITLHAESVRAEGDAISRAYGGGFVDVGAARTDTTVEPTINAYID
ncbi:MAG: hypothetical protein B7Z52_03455, partial [Burkholderiales bacterium 12-64-5]